MLILERFSLSPTETEGRLYFNDKIFWTIEPPWRNNQAKKSCIPLGQYRLTSYASPRFGPVYALDNPDLGVFVHPEPKNPKNLRSLILIHPANFASQLEGCIALGTTRTFMIDSRSMNQIRPAVTRSRDACAEIYRALSKGEVSPILEIRQRGYV